MASLGVEVALSGVIGDWFESGAVIWLVLAFVMMEAVLLLTIRKRTGRGGRPLPLIANLAAGAFLMLAIRAALLDQTWIWISLFMLLALIAHLLDIGGRFLVSRS